MNPDPHRLDAYFSGQTSPAEERTLAQELANNASLADQFVEQARVDALLGEVFTDQRAGKFHEALVARIMTVEELKPVAKTSPKVIRGPFPYWKQVAAVVAMGLFLWGISSVWYGASQLAEANPRKKPAPRIAGVQAPAVASTDPTPTAVEEDRELEAWLRKYFVGTQPLMERSLEDWLVALVEKEFPQHNHLNKHRNLTWEIRATTPEAQESLARQNVRLQCAPGSLMDQVRGLAALAGCDVHVEPDKFVLTPMKESSAALEAREMMLSDAFVNGETVVSNGPLAQQVTTWEDRSKRYIADDIAVADFIVSPSDPDPVPLVALRILQSAIDWPKGAEVTAVMPVQQPIVSGYSGGTITYTLPLTFRTGENGGEAQLLSYAGGTSPADLTSGLTGVPVLNGYGGFTSASMAFKVNLQTSPRGFHQLAILNQLPKPATSEPKLTITDYTFAANQAPLAKDRVIVGDALQALMEAYQSSALSTLIVDTRPEIASQPSPITYMLPTQVSSNDLPSLQTPAIGVSFNATDQPDPIIQFSGSSDFPVTPNIPTNWSFKAATAAASQASLTLTRSGELLKISGSIDLPVSTPPVVFETQPAPIEIIREYGMEDAAAEIVRLADETKTPNVSIDAHFVESEIPLAESTLTLSPATGVDISLSLFPGQGAVVTGPTVDDKVHYYLLKLAE